MRVIILGGSGFIGRALTQALISRGDEVVVPTPNTSYGMGRITRA